MKRTVIIILAYLSLVSCIAQKSDFKISDNHFNQDFSDSCNIFNKVFNEGLMVMPILIEFIDLKQKSRVGFHDPSSSSFYEFSQNNYKGIKAAYLIEYLLAIDSIESGKIDKQINTFNIYGYGVIVRQNNGDAIKKPLTYDDIKKVKQIYEDWWSRNKNKTLHQLRDEWQQKGSVLTGSNYKWI